MSKYDSLEHESLVLRVKRESELDGVLRQLLKEQSTPEQLAVAGGTQRAGKLFRRTLDKWFDNVRLEAEWGDPDKKVTMHYTDIAPQAIPIGGSGVSNESADIPTELQMRWPQAPPIIDLMENFDKPTWFDRMDKMVELGRHISIASPPGVGKDTAVQQLAAIKGRPLVTIGGDAGFRRRDLVGSPQIVSGTSYFSVAEYVAAVVNGWWVLLTEVNAADADALMYINTQLAAPNIAEVEGRAYRVHPDFRLFITYNHGLVGTKPLPQSFKDRFYSIKLGFFTEAQLRKRLYAMGMTTPENWSVAQNYFPAVVITADEVIENDKRTPRTGIAPDDAKYSTWAGWPNEVVKFGIAMWEAHERGQMRYQITTRRLFDAVTLVQDCGVDYTEALKDAVIGAIDSPVEAKAAEQVLSSLLK